MGLVRYRDLVFRGKQNRNIQSTVDKQDREKKLQNDRSNQFSVDSYRRSSKKWGVGGMEKVFQGLDEALANGGVFRGSRSFWVLQIGEAFRVEKRFRFS